MPLWCMSCGMLAAGGLSLENDADEIAGMILKSRWLAA